MDTVTSDSFSFENFLKRKGLLDQTLKHYFYYLEKLKEILEGREIDQEFVYKFLDRYNNAVSRAFLKNYLGFVKKANLEIPKQTGSKNKKQKVVRFISRDEVNKIYEAMKDTGTPQRNSLMVAISFQGGLRMDELLSIEPLDFRWSKWKKDPLEPGDLVVKGKRNKQRVVNMSPELMKLIRDYIQKLQTMQDMEKEDKLFTLNKSTWQKLLADQSRKILGKAIHPHVLRHSLAMYCKDELKWPLERISKYLGHKSLQTTLIYVQTSDAEIKEAFKEGFS